jgi:hypothetical protein
MDNEYILMCKSATEIQEMWKPAEHDKIYNKSLEQYNLKNNKNIEAVECLSSCQLLVCENDIKDWSFWIPRQEALQRMCGDNNVQCMFSDLDAFWAYEDEKYHKWMIGADMDDFFNRIWLMFTMIGVYNKRWNTETKKWELIE